MYFVLDKIKSLHRFFRKCLDIMSHRGLKTTEKLSLLSNKERIVTIEKKALNLKELPSR